MPGLVVGLHATDNYYSNLLATSELDKCIISRKVWHKCVCTEDTHVCGKAGKDLGLTQIRI